MFLYTYKDCEYIVDIVESQPENIPIVKVKFIQRTLGGKGRLPTPKSVHLNELTQIFSSDKVASMLACD